ncbi:MAG: SbcC/MukB-like Walker B domain-containing protein [Longimicrobiales bacterium]
MGSRREFPASYTEFRTVPERRSVVTLSGGETFLASLSLALGLAQGITDIAGHSAGARLESMFIDEGFGTLDPTALDLAVEAMERLRKGERMVGVITHVPALAERIPTGITVEKHGGGSVVGLR